MPSLLKAIILERIIINHAVHQLRIFASNIVYLPESSVAVLCVISRLGTGDFLNEQWALNRKRAMPFSPKSDKQKVFTEYFGCDVKCLAKTFD